MARLHVNDEGAPVRCPNKQTAPLLQPDAPVRLLFYCSRSLGSDGSCGPNNGPQCGSCQRFQRSVEWYTTQRCTNHFELCSLCGHAPGASQINHSVPSLSVTAKRSPTGSTTILELAETATVLTLAQELAKVNGCDASRVVAIFEGAVLDPAAVLKDAACVSANAVSVVYMIKP